MNSNQVCVYCQATPATTDDHVPPKNLFRDQDKKKLQLRTVPSCESCNNSNSVNETRFRDVIALMAGPASAEEVYEAFLRSLNYEPSKRGRILRDAYRNKHGELVWATVSSPLVETVTKVAKGLHFIAFGKPWPIKARIDTYLDPKEQLQELKNDNATQHVSMGEPFAYSFIDDSGTSIWWLHFYGKLEAIVSFEPPIGQVL
jgi:hypothetical protein